MRTPKQVLVEARELISNGWTQGTYSRDAQTYSVDPVSESASCFCILGAIRRVEAINDVADADNSLTENFKAATVAICSVIKPLGYDHVPEFNDDKETTVEKVLEVFDKAIESL